MVIRGGAMNAGYVEDVEDVLNGCHSMVAEARTLESRIGYE